MIIFTESVTSVKKLSEAVGVELSECESKPTQTELQRELVSDVQLAPKPSTETIGLLQNLGMSFEEAAGRLLEL